MLCKDDALQCSVQDNRAQCDAELQPRVMSTEYCPGEVTSSSLTQHLDIYNCFVFTVTVRAGPSHSKNYENFVSNNLKDEVLKEITSNLEDTIKEEALAVFIDSVKGGFSIKDCIFKVQDEVLPNVPKERNKFFIKFTYDNQLQVKI